MALCPLALLLIMRLNNFLLTVISVMSINLLSSPMVLALPGILPFGWWLQIKTSGNSVDKKSNSLDEDKSISDSKALKLVLTDFFNLHPNAQYHTFLGDSIFDSYTTYPMLLVEFKFKKVLIPLNTRNPNPDLPPLQYDENGWPLCSKDPSRTMKPGGWTHEEGSSNRF